MNNNYKRINIYQQDGKHIIEINRLKSIVIINEIIMYLNKIKNEKNVHIIFNFKNLKKQSYTSIHVTIAGIADYYVVNYGFTIEYETKENQYFNYTKTKKPLQVLSNIADLNKNIFDKVISFESSEDVYYISKRIMEQLQNTVTCEKGVLQGLSWCMNEVMDNVLNHSAVSNGYIMVQVHKYKKHISISIFDTGIGLFNSLKNSKEYVPNNELESIELAIQKGVTRDKEFGQGNGMWGLSQIVKDNNGYLSIMTGHTNVTYNYEKKTNKTSTNIPIISEKNLCTRVDFTLNFDNLINVNKALDNYEPAEYINMKIDNMMTYEGWIDFIMKEQANSGTGTRQAGKKLRINILNMVKINEAPVLLNFEGIDEISSSFADEFIAKLVQEIGFVQFNAHFRIINTNKFVLGLIEKAIYERQKIKNDSQ